MPRTRQATPRKKATPKAKVKFFVVCASLFREGHYNRFKGFKTQAEAETYAKSAGPREDQDKVVVQLISKTVKGPWTTVAV